MRFLAGLLIGGLACGLCALWFLPLNIQNDIRGWINKPAVQIVQADTTE